MTDQHILRCLSYNIHKGFSFDRRFVLGAIKQAIESTGAELIFLQEVIGEHTGHSKSLKEWPIQPQLEFLADTLWPHFAYGKNAVYTEGHHGNAIMSRRPFRMYENIDISNNRFEKRGLLHATIEPHHKQDPELHVVCVHLDLFESGRAMQYERIVRRIHQHVPDSCPLIIAGDFNDWRETASPILESELGVREVYQSIHGRHARSFPSWFPFLRLDRIYVRGLQALDAKCFVEEPWDKLSDHGALFTTLSRFS
jgi:endonuclease/exonuclease/phosphatase family metal-dependent hydrolase